MSRDDTDVDVEETNLSEEDQEKNEEGKGNPNNRSGGETVLGLLIDFLVAVISAVVNESVGQEISRAVASYEKARRRLRTLGVLALTVLVLLLLAAIVWLLVGVVFLADRFPATGDPLVFAVGVAAGYVLAVVAGLVYSR